MCSILGASGTEQIDPKVMRLLYMMGEDRGGHGCGYTDGTNVVKSTATAPHFIKESIFTKPSPEFIGHTRFKTVGPTKADNNHPFKFDNIVGVHNGTIYNNDELQKEEGVSFEVDSEMLYYLIDKYGLKHTLPRLTGKVGLAFWDKDKILNLYRFDRPLSIGYKDGMLFYASLGSYLKAIGCEGVKEIPEHTLYRIKDGRVLSAKQLKKTLMPSKKEVSQKSTSSDTQIYRTPAYYFRTELPPAIADLAIKNITNSSNQPSFKDAFIKAFDWKMTEQGQDYWKTVYDTYIGVEDTDLTDPDKMDYGYIPLKRKYLGKFAMAPVNAFKFQDVKTKACWWLSEDNRYEVYVEELDEMKYYFYRLDRQDGFDELISDYPQIAEDVVHVISLLEREHED